MQSNIFINGDKIEFGGEVTDNFLPYSNSIEASRGGKIYSSTEVKVKTVSIESVMADAEEFEVLQEFLESCEASTNKFTVTVVMNEHCSDDSVEYTYTGCLISGEPEYALYAKKVSNFEFAYESRIKKGGK